MAATTEVIVIPDSSPARIWAPSVSPCSPQRLSPVAFQDPSSPSSPARSLAGPAFGNTAQREKTPLSEEIGRENIPILSQSREPKIQTDEAARNADSQRSAQRTKSGKARSKKPAKEGDNNKVLNGKVVKSTTARSKEVKNSRTDKETSGTGEGAGQTQDLHDQGLNLEEAMTRRRDWTPPRSTTPIEIVDTEDEGDEVQPKGRAIGDLLSNYRFTNNRAFPEESENLRRNGQPPTKRRRIELVDYYVADPKNFKKPPPRQTSDKADPKNKTRTITGLVTGRYAAAAEASRPSIGKFFDLEENPVNVAGDRPKKAKKRKTASKKTEPEYVILSPEAATESLRGQDFLFGTCSQLESGDSPTFLRETQKALLASEAVTVGETFPTRPSTLTSRFTGSKGLWSAAARDADGSTMQPEVLDLTDSPDLSLIGQNTTDESRDEPESPTIVRQRSSAQPEPVEVRASDLGKSRDPEKPPSSSNQSTQSRKTTSKSSAPPPEMPRYSGYTNAELSRLIASYRLKPIKSRKKMIEVLEQCWRNLHPEAARPESSTASQKLERGQPTKARRQPKTKNNLQASQQGTEQSRNPDPEPPTRPMPEEIEDSEEELIPSPTRMQRQRMQSRGATPAVPFSLPLTRATTTTRGTQRGRKDADDDHEPSLLTQITKAIHAQRPPTSNSDSASSRPLTWHEKMLLYDPIVLEDLTTWLNTEGLDMINEDRQVGIAEVREWCEMKGICCCSRR